MRYLLGKSMSTLVQNEFPDSGLSSCSRGALRQSGRGRRPGLEPVPGAPRPRRGGSAPGNARAARDSGSDICEHEMSSFGLPWEQSIFFAIVFFFEGSDADVG